MNISKQLINGFLQTELELFKKQFNKSLTPEIQDDRSLAIAWVCYFFKDSITAEVSSGLVQFVDEVHSQNKYNTHGWHRIAALEAAAFILTSNRFYANVLCQYTACGQSSTRLFILQCACIISPLLSFSNRHLKGATETNIKYHNTHFEDSVAVYLSSKGTNEDKRVWFEQQFTHIKKDQSTPFLNEIRTDGVIRNRDTFIYTFNKAKSYFIFKVLSKPTLVQFEAELFDETAIDFERLLDAEKQHPLCNYFIDLKYLKSEDILPEPERK